MERVITDIFNSIGVVNSTPNFVVLSGGQGRILNGSRPAEQFVTILQGVLEEATSGE